MRLKVVVATRPKAGYVDAPGEDLRLTKIGLLYGDEVEVISPIASMVNSLHLLEDFDDQRLLGIFPRVLPHLGLTSDVILEVNQTLDSMRKLRGYDKTLARAVKPVLEPLRTRLEETVKQTGFGELERATKSGLVKVRRSIWDPDDNFVSILAASSRDNQNTIFNQDIPNWLNSLMDAVKSETVVPLMDDGIHKIVKLALDNTGTGLEVNALATNKDGAYSRRLFELLEGLDHASIPDVLDIRKCLNKYLKRFRAATMKLAREMKSFPHDPIAFQAEFVNSYRLNVEPTLEAVDGVIEEEHYLREFLRKVGDKPIAAVVAVAAYVVGAAAGFPEAMKIAATTVLGLAPSAVAAWDDRERKQRERANGLYFYHQSARRLVPK